MKEIVRTLFQTAAKLSGSAGWSHAGNNLLEIGCAIVYTMSHDRTVKTVRFRNRHPRI